MKYFKSPPQNNKGIPLLFRWSWQFGPNSDISSLCSKIIFIAFLGSCGGNFSDEHGHLSSPSYPNYYPTNTDCIYTISQPRGTVILLNFFSMDIQWLGHYNGQYCHNDYLEIRDGPSDDSPFLGKLCGSVIPAPIQSSQNQLRMK